MQRQYYLDLAAAGLRMPVGTDLVLREKADHDAILRDGRRLGQVLEESARRYRTPLAIHLMDLTLEKAALLGALGVPENQHDTYHFSHCPSPQMIEKASQDHAPSLRMQANIDAIRYIAKNTSLVPIAMTIGPFSLMTKLLADPITPLYLGGTGVRGEDNPEVQMVEVTLEMAVQVVLRSITAQIAAGAKAVFVAEPAANKAYISPNQIAAGSDIFERFVMNPNRRIKALLDRYNVDLIFHCCGELIDSMVQHFASLDPAILSLGSSRKLWEDSALVSKRTVLYGNLPTKRFYSDDAITIDQVCQQARELIDQMCQVNHPFILGSECDVLSVPGCEKTIRAKVDAMMTCDCAACL